MAQMTITIFSQSLKRFTDFCLILPTDTPPEFAGQNPAYQRPPKTLFLLHGYSGSMHDFLFSGNAQNLAMKYNLAIVCASGENSFYLNQKGTGRAYGDYFGVELPAYLQKTFGIAKTPEETMIGADDVSDAAGKEKKEQNGYDQLAELIGMEEVAKRVREIVSQVKLSLSDPKLDRPCIHMRFLGAPGTGKTTVARIIGQIFREEGILRKGAFIEYSARSLCAEYVGQTAVKTASICRDSYGSVLFLDEAYSLYDNDIATNDYGKEALTTLISEMENHRDDMLVIMAGYTEDMETLMKGNAGLRSRMPYEIMFKNYSRSELFEIFMLMVRKHFSYTEEFEAEAKSYFMALSDGYLNSKEFANARFVRNLYERTWSKGALRASLSGLARVELIKDDFIAASSEKEFSEKRETERAKIGF